MRLQPTTWASNTSASRRAVSIFFSARCLAVQSRRAPRVQTCSVVAVAMVNPFSSSFSARRERWAPRFMFRMRETSAKRRQLTNSFQIYYRTSIVARGRQVAAFEALLLVIRSQRVDHVAHVAGDDEVE